MVIMPHTGAYRSGLVFFDTLHSLDDEALNNEKLMEAIRKEHLSTEECNPFVDHSQKLLPIVIHNNGRPLDCECRQ